MRFREIVMPTFAQNFAIGDVVYGLSQSRSPYVNSLNPTEIGRAHV